VYELTLPPRSDGGQLESCRFHDLRHTVVTRLLESGQPFGVIPDIMGWSPATTVRMIKRYGHIGSVARRTAMAALEAAG